MSGPEAAAIKLDVRRCLRDLAHGADAAEIWHPDAVAEVSHPWGMLDPAGLAALWADLRRALPDMERHDLIAVAGANREGARLSGPRAPHLVAFLGHLEGTFAEPLLGIRPTRGAVTLRIAEAHWLDGARIRRPWTILDLVGPMRQADVRPLPRSLGAEAAWPGPATQDGLAPEPAGGDALAAVFAMHDALHAFDGRDIASMPYERHWARGFTCYAGGGIGAARGVEGFRAHHQIPFLRALPIAPRGALRARRRGAPRGHGRARARHACGRAARDDAHGTQGRDPGDGLPPAPTPKGASPRTGCRSTSSASPRRWGTTSSRGLRITRGGSASRSDALRPRRGGRNCGPWRSAP